MFKLRRWTKGWVFVGLVVCAVFLAGANPEIGYARPLLATAPNLGTAGSYAVLGGSTVTNVPAAGTVIVGNLGVWPGLAITGFPPGIVVPPGTIHAGDAAAQSAQSDVTTAYNFIGSGNQSCPGANNKTGIDLGGLTLAAGVYCFDTSAQLTGMLTLNGINTDVWIFQIGSTLTTASNSSVVLSGTANACNVFWQIGTSATLGTSTSFNGNILALSAITLNHRANIVSGRALARNAAVTLDDNSVNASACTGVAASGVGANKVFSPNSMIVGGVTTLTIALSNANGTTDATITSFTDNLPSGLVVANPSNASTTCVGGTLVANPGGSTVSMTGGTIPHAVGGIPGTCTIRVNVTAVRPGNYTNTLSANALVTTGGNNTGSSGAALSVNAAPAPAPATPREVPEGDTLLLFGGGIGGLATWLGWQWRKARARSKQ